MPGFDEAVEHVHNDVVKADKPQLLLRTLFNAERSFGRHSLIHCQLSVA